MRKIIVTSTTETDSYLITFNTNELKAFQELYALIAPFAAHQDFNARVAVRNTLNQPSVLIINGRSYNLEDTEWTCPTCGKQFLFCPNELNDSGNFECECGENIWYEKI